MDGLDGWTGLDPLRSLVPLEHLAVLKTFILETNYRIIKSFVMDFHWLVKHYYDFLPLKNAIYFQILQYQLLCQLRYIYDL